MDFVNRFGAKATKAKQAQSKLRSLEKMETIEIKPLPVRARIPKACGMAAVIKADAQVPHGRVVHVMDTLKQVGIGRVAFGVSPVPQEPSKAPVPAPAGTNLPPWPGVFPPCCRARCWRAPRDRKSVV